MKETSYHTVNISISLPRTLRDAARQAAFDDSRSLSSLITRLLNQHLQKEGYLEEKSPRFRLRHDSPHYPGSFCLHRSGKSAALVRFN